MENARCLSRDGVFVFLSSSSSIYLFKRDSYYFLFFITFWEAEVSVIPTIDQQHRLPTPVDFFPTLILIDVILIGGSTEIINSDKLAHMHILSIL